PHLSLVAGRGEPLPRNPTLFGAVEAPAPDARAGDEQGPARLARPSLKCVCRVRRVRQQFNPVRAPRPADLDARGLADLATVDAAGRDGVLDVAADQQDRAPGPRVIVQRAVVVVPQELVQVDIEDRIARDDPPAQQVRAFRTADDEVWLAALGAFDDPKGNAGEQSAEQAHASLPARRRHSAMTSPTIIQSGVVAGLRKTTSMM